jgi:hypothetical protein
MQRLIVGSTAMARVLSISRAPKDLDIFTPDPHHDPSLRVETFWHPLLERWISPGTDRFATLDELFTIKVAHAPWELKNGSWLKHMWDICQFKRAGAVVHQPFHDDLYKICEEIHGPKKVDLNKDKTTFFSPTVRRTFDHDSIHETVCYYDEPLYRAVLRDGSSVAIDMNKVYSLSFEDQIRLYREETYVTALERRVIPENYRTSRRTAYAWALKQMITSFTKGWSAQFIIENFDIFRVPDVDYVSVHLSQKHKLVKLETS